MAKTKAYKWHKIKIHHNRWLIWAIAYLVFVGIALLGYLKLANLDLENSENTFMPMHSYSDQRLGFSLRYPANWSIESSSSNVTFLPSQISDEGVNVSVVSLGSEKSVRSALKIKKETSISFNGVSATKIINDLGNGHSETVVLAPYNKKLYVIRGSEQHVEDLLQTFYFVTR